MTTILSARHPRLVVFLGDFPSEFDPSFAIYTYAPDALIIAINSKRGDTHEQLHNKLNARSESLEKLTKNSKKDVKRGPSQNVHLRFSSEQLPCAICVLLAAGIEPELVILGEGVLPDSSSSSSSSSSSLDADMCDQCSCNWLNRARTLVTGLSYQLPVQSLHELAERSQRRIMHDAPFFVLAEPEIKGLHCDDDLGARIAPNSIKRLQRIERRRERRRRRSSEPQTAASLALLKAQESADDAEEDDEHAREPPLLSLYMIVKNEAGGLEVTLRSVLPHVDQLTVLDTGSEDGTPAIIERLVKEEQLNRQRSKAVFLNERAQRRREAEREGLQEDDDETELEEEAELERFRNITLALHHGPFVDFSTTRNYALSLHSSSFPVNSSSIFTLMLNGDDTLVGAEQMRQFLEPRRHLCGATEQMFITSIDYEGHKLSWSERLMRTSNHRYPHWPFAAPAADGAVATGPREYVYDRWHYEGVTHEVYTHPLFVSGSIGGYAMTYAGRPTTSAASAYDALSFHVWHTYVRDTPDRLKARAAKDVALLKRQLETKPDDERTLYYISHSLDVQEEYAEAYIWHERRIRKVRERWLQQNAEQMERGDGSLSPRSAAKPIVADQEECTCLLRLGKISAYRMNDDESYGWKVALPWFELARSLCPDQIETRFYLAQHAMLTQDLKAAKVYAYEARELLRSGRGLHHVLESDTVHQQTPQLVSALEELLQQQKQTQKEKKKKKKAPVKAQHEEL